jgi:hypothetical protein
MPLIARLFQLGESDIAALSAAAITLFATPATPRCCHASCR